MMDQTKKYATMTADEMSHILGHSIPRPYSQTMVEDLHVTNQQALADGFGERMMELAKEIHGE